MKTTSTTHFLGARNLFRFIARFFEVLRTAPNFAENDRRKMEWAKAGMGNARPHPGPLPQERESHSHDPIIAKANPAGTGLRQFERRETIPPLPGGEGRGEGGRPPIFEESPVARASPAAGPLQRAEARAPFALRLRRLSLIPALLLVVPSRARVTSPGPTHRLERGAISLPKVDAVVMHPGHDAHALGLAVESCVSQEPSDEMSRVIRPHVQKCHAVSCVTKRPLEEILVQREESHAPLTVQQRNDVGVFNSAVGKLPSNLPERNAPFLQQWPLIFREIFVQQTHATASSAALGAGRPYGSSHASLASRTASATAASGIFPPQRVLQMKSHDRPSATSSNTCHTMMRVPLNVGLPWHISGSATMYRPSSTRCFTPLFMGKIVCAV